MDARLCIQPAKSEAMIFALRLRPEHMASSCTPTGCRSHSHSHSQKPSGPAKGATAKAFRHAHLQSLNPRHQSSSHASPHAFLFARSQSVPWAKELQTVHASTCSNMQCLVMSWEANTMAGRWPVPPVREARTILPERCGRLSSLRLHRKNLDQPRSLKYCVPVVC